MDAKLTAGVYGFTGEYNFLSNFYPCEIEYEGISYPTTEHAYQAAKTLDQEERLQISKISAPGNSKRAGRRVKLRDDWEEVKVEVMKELLIEKFKHPELSKALQNTGDMYLEETNWWGDTFWGVCEGKGKNQLGHLLMLVRDAL